MPRPENPHKKRKPGEHRKRDAPIAELIPKDYTGPLPPGMEETIQLPARAESEPFPVAGGNIPAARGFDAPKRRGAQRILEWQTALKWALKNYETDRVARGAAIRAIALTTINLAIQGDKDARAEIANRLDGKAVQQVEQVTDTTVTIVHRIE